MRRLRVGSWSSFKRAKWRVATVACVQHVDAVSEFSDSSDKGVNGDDGSEAGSDVGGTGGWPSTMANGYGEYTANICTIHTIGKRGKTV